MSATAFRAQSRTVQRFTGLPGAEKVRLWPMVAKVLDDARADSQEIGDQVVLGALNSVLTAGIMAGRYREVHAILGNLLGLGDSDGKSEIPATGDVPGGNSLPGREARRPLAKAAR
jgi:hypothetical protein